MSPLLATRDFRFFLLARFSTVLAQSCTVLALGWQVYDISRMSMDIPAAAFRLGLIGLAQFLPLLACTFFSGWVIDRIDRRLVIRSAVGLHLLCSTSLFLLAWHGSTSLTLLFAIASFLGIVRAFFMPAANAITPNLVPRDVLPRAIAALSMASRSGAILGPVAGGLAYAAAPQLAFALSMALLSVALVCLFALAPIARTAMAGTAPLLRQLTQGWDYVRSHHLILGTITLDLFAVLLGGITALLPIFARDVLFVGPTGLGLLRGAPAIGALLVALVLSVRPLRRNIGAVMLVAVGMFGAATIGFGLSRWLPLSLLFLVVLGGFDMLSVNVRQSLIQLATPDAMRGRVGAISTLSVSASNELGEFESGIVASLLGPVMAVVVSGAAAVAISLAWAKVFPELLRVKSFGALAAKDDRP